MQSKALSHLNLNCALQAAGHGVRPEKLEACAHLMARAFHDDPAVRYLLEGTDLGPGDWRCFLHGAAGGVREMCAAFRRRSSGKSADSVPTQPEKRAHSGLLPPGRREAPAAFRPGAVRPSPAIRGPLRPDPGKMSPAGGLALHVPGGVPGSPGPGLPAGGRFRHSRHAHRPIRHAEARYPLNWAQKTERTRLGGSVPLVCENS